MKTEVRRNQWKENQKSIFVGQEIQNSTAHETFNNWADK